MGMHVPPTSRNVFLPHVYFLASLHFMRPNSLPLLPCVVRDWVKQNPVRIRRVKLVTMFIVTLKNLFWCRWCLKDVTQIQISNLIFKAFYSHGSGTFHEQKPSSEYKMHASLCLCGVTAIEHSLFELEPNIYSVTILSNWIFNPV